MTYFHLLNFKGLVPPASAEIGITMVDETSRTLLNGIRQSPEDERWSVLVELYTPFIRSILAGCGVRGNDVDDVVQNVLTVVVRRLKEFDRQRTGSFRAWLRAITVNAMREHWRSKPTNLPTDDESGAVFAELQDPNSEMTQYFNQEHNRHVLSYLMDRVKADFRDATWQAFQLLAIEHMSVDEVAEQLNITPNAAFIARSRVMKRLKEVGAELLE